MSLVSRLVWVALLLLLACTPSDPMQEMRELHTAGRYAESIDRLRRLVDEDPSSAEANLLLGTALQKTGNSGLAIWSLRKAAESPEYAVAAGLLLTEAMLESRTAPDAVEEIDRVLALEPDNVQAWVLRVEANQASGNLEAALDDIDRVLELDPDNLAVAAPRITTLIGLERIDEAGAALDAATGRFEDSESKVSKTMIARLCIARGLFNFVRGERDLAETQYAECIDRFPNERIAVAESVRFYDQIGKSERATEILQRAFEVTRSPLFRTSLARRLGALGRPAEEERLLLEDTEENPSALSWFVLADYYVDRESYEQALSAFERAIEVGPATPRLRFAYADTLVRAGRYDEARRVSAALEHPELKNLIRGRILLGEGKSRAALAAFEKGVRLWPNNAVGRFLAGQAAERVGDFARAISHYRESFRTSPGGSEAGRALAELYAAQGEHAGALQIASRYIHQRPRDPEAYLLSIRLADALGQQKIVDEGISRLSYLPGGAAVALAEEATLLAGSKGVEAAVEAIEKSALDLTEPAHGVALRALVEQLGRLSRHEQAVAATERALAAHSDEAAFHELHGVALQAGGRGDAARTAFERALELDPQSWRAAAGLAALAADAGNRSEALALYDRAIAGDPESPAPALAAVALVRDSDPDAAVVRLEALLDHHPREAAAANDLARLLLERGDLDAAQRQARRAAWLGLADAQATLERIGELRAEAGAK